MMVVLCLKRKKASRQTEICPKIIKDYFSASSDDEFKTEHPVSYVFVVLLGLAVLLLPEILFFILVNSYNNWLLLGIAGGFVFGIGLFNFVAKILNQYLGHWVSILCFFTGGIMMLLSFILGGGSI